MKHKRGPKSGLTSAIKAKLGTVPDTVLADETGYNRATIRKWREVNGVPSCERPIRERDEPFDARLLGLVPDAWVAEVNNVSRQAVSLRRSAKGIPAARNGEMVKAVELLLELRDCAELEGEIASIPSSLLERIEDFLAR